ncbi:MAG: hypothetical protein K5Q68_03370 [Roseococcus sp.]|nr:hypothetical protein [Roseococcus sp.]
MTKGTNATLPAEWPPPLPGPRDPAWRTPRPLPSEAVSRRWATHKAAGFAVASLAGRIIPLPVRIVVQPNGAWADCGDGGPHDAGPTGWAAVARELLAGIAAELLAGNGNPWSGAAGSVEIAEEVLFLATAERSDAALEAQLQAAWRDAAAMVARPEIWGAVVEMAEALSQLGEPSQAEWLAMCERAAMRIHGAEACADMLQWPGAGFARPSYSQGMP